MACRVAQGEPARAVEEIRSTARKRARRTGRPSTRLRPGEAGSSLRARAQQTSLSCGAAARLTPRRLSTQTPQ